MVKEKTTEKFECEYCRKEYDYKRDAENCEARDKKKKEMEKIERATKFTITENHLKLLKRFNVDWVDCEFGAPRIDPKRPYGNSNVLDDIAEILGVKKTKENVEDYDKEEASEYSDKQEYIEDLEWNEETYNKFDRLHKEMQIVLQIIFATGKIEVGDYLKKDEYDYESWKKSGETNENYSIEKEVFKI